MLVQSEPGAFCGSNAEMEAFRDKLLLNFTRIEKSDLEFGIDYYKEFTTVPKFRFPQICDPA